MWAKISILMQTNFKRQCKLKFLIQVKTYSKMCLHWFTKFLYLLQKNDFFKFLRDQFGNFSDEIRNCAKVCKMPPKEPENLAKVVENLAKMSLNKSKKSINDIKIIDSAGKLTFLPPTNGTNWKCGLEIRPQFLGKPEKYFLINFV